MTDRIVVGADGRKYITNERMPEPAAHFSGPMFSAEQMREYARAAVLAEREACAKVCESIAKKDGAYGIAEACAAAIRAREGA